MNEELVVCILALLLTALRGGSSFKQVDPVVCVPYLKERRSGRQ